MPEKLRLCTWNIQLGMRLDVILKVIEMVTDFRTVDLLALQEASFHSDEQDAYCIAKALGPDYAAFQKTAHTFGTQLQANALVWNAARIRVMRQDSLPLPMARDLELSRAERALLLALPVQRRMSLVVEGMLADVSLRLYVAHLDVLGWMHKWGQLNAILSDAQARQPAAQMTLLAADLNTFRFRSRPTWTALALAAKRAGFEDLTTDIRWTHYAVRSIPFRQKLDAIFVRQAQPVAYRSWSVDAPGSDHIPVFADVVLPHG